MTDLVYLHVPKTGGTYTARNGVLDPINDLNHSVFIDGNFDDKDYPPSPGYLAKMKKDVSVVNKPDRICFATVRNPYSWLVSYWFHAGCNIPENENPSHYDYRLARKGFSTFVEGIAKRDVGWPSKKFIHFAFFSYKGDFMIDRLIHQEDLDSELKELAADYKLSYTPQDRVMVGKATKNYVDYYDDNLRSLVRDVWGRELALFGYDFWGRNFTGILDKGITEKHKEEIKYVWKTNILKIGEEAL